MHLLRDRSGAKHRRIFHRRKQRHDKPELAFSVHRKKAQLEFAVLPANAGNPAIRWLSSDASIADVTGTGLVKGIAPGTAVISAVSVDSPDKRGQCTVTVSNPPDFTETRATASSD